MGRAGAVRAMACRVVRRPRTYLRAARAARPQGCRLREDGHGYDAHEVEKAMLLDPEARLGADGYYDAR